MPSVGKTPTSLPSRTTVTRSETSITSANLWLTKTTAIPCADRVRTTAKQCIRLALGQRRGWFVHKNQPRLSHQGACDSDDLTLCNRQVQEAVRPDQAVRPTGPAQLASELDGAGPEIETRDKANHLVERNIFGNGHVRE